MSLTMNFVGLVYFVHEANDRRVLLPDGTKPLKSVPPHYASFFLEKADVRDADWWTTEQRDLFVDHGVVEYPIPNAKTVITITGVSDKPRGATPLNTAAHEPSLLKIKSVNPDFVVDTVKPDAIADMTIKQGTLTSCKFGGAIVSRLRSDHGGPLRIEATFGGQTKYIELNDDAEIVLSNTSDVFAPKPKAPVPEDDHFQLYARLDQNRAFDKLTQPPQVDLSSLPALGSNSTYLALVQQELGFEIPQMSCSNGCC